MYYAGQIVHDKDTGTPVRMSCTEGSPWCWNTKLLNKHPNITPYYKDGKIWAGLDSDTAEAYHKFRNGELTVK